MEKKERLGKYKGSDSRIQRKSEYRSEIIREVVYGRRKRF